MTNIDKVRVIILGDSGVGKTCLTHLIAHNEALTHPGWTVGCSVEVKFHEYKEGTPQQNTFFVELYDIGASLNHKNSRSVFYAATHGIILVHDLTNRRSHENLKEWLMEILNKEGKDTFKPSNNLASADISDFDAEQFLGSTQIPILVIGTKFDMLDEKRRSRNSQIPGGIAEQCGAEEIWLSCHDSRSLAPGTTDAVKLARFFDKVIEKKHYSRESGIWLGGERRKFSTPYNTPDNSLLFTSPQLHNQQQSFKSPLNFN